MVLKSTDFLQFMIWEAVVVLKELIFKLTFNNLLIWEGVVILK